MYLSFHDKTDATLGPTPRDVHERHGVWESRNLEVAICRSHGVVMYGRSSTWEWQLVRAAVRSSFGARELHYLGTSIALLHSNRGCDVVYYSFVCIFGYLTVFIVQCVSADATLNLPMSKPGTLEYPDVSVNILVSMLDLQLFFNKMVKMILVMI